MTTRSFPTDAVVSVTTGILAAKNFGDVHSVIAFVLADPNIMTHQLPAAAGPARAAVLAQHPELAEIEFPQYDKSTDAWKVEFQEHIDLLNATFGAVLDLESTGHDEWIADRALEDLSAFGKPAIIVNVGEQA